MSKARHRCKPELLLPAELGRNGAGGGGESDCFGVALFMILSGDDVFRRSLESKQGHKLYFINYVHVLRAHKKSESLKKIQFKLKNKAVV